MLARILAGALFAASAFAQVDPVLLNLVMPDSVVLTGIQVSQSLASPIGQYLLSKMQVDDAKFLQFVAATGFDPTRDLTQVVAATGATSANQNNVLILGRGSFLTPQITAAATANGATVTQYGGLSILAAPDSQTSFVFLNNTTAAIGSLAMVEAAIDRFNAGATYSGNLVAPVQTVSAANSAWFATQTPLSDFLNGKLPGGATGLSQSNLLQNVIAANGGVNFAQGGVVLTANAVTTSAQNAQALADVLKFLASMIQTNANGAPVTGLAGAATFTVNGSTTQISLSISEQQAEQLFMQSGDSNARHAKKIAR
jgi:hypothetical protein